MLRFAVIAAPRTGSNLLCTLLNSHPEILCHHEVFNPQDVFIALTHRNGKNELGSLAERDHDPLAFLDRVWRSGQNYRSVGFKWTRGQNNAVLQSVLNDSGVKKIVVRRNNPVKTYVSELIAIQTQQWEVYNKQDLLLPRPSVTVDCTELMQHISATEHFYRDIYELLKRSEQPYIDVVYESLLSSSEHARILKFLSVNDVNQKLVPASIKQNPTDLRDSIDNFSELTKTLVNSDLEANLYDNGM